MTSSSSLGPGDLTTGTHWGAYRVRKSPGERLIVEGIEGEKHPSAMTASVPDWLNTPLRIGQPMVRESYLREGAAAGGAGRGREAFVPVSWDRAEKLVAAELTRIRQKFGNQAIFGGSYGWSSAGRFHHAQSQLHRFLNGFGGYVRSVNTYSNAAADVLVQHILGSKVEILHRTTTWPVIVDNTELLVMFGGLPAKNAQVNSGGVSRHHTPDWLQQYAKTGHSAVNIAPMRDCAPDVLDSDWLPVRPNTDTALMLGLAHVLYSEDLYDADFLSRYCVGFARFQSYITGEADGIAKTPEWAAEICGIAPETLRQLARRMAAHRTLITVAWGLQRGDRGEQPYWMAVVLAAMLGQIGLPGGGIALGLATLHGVGNATDYNRWAALPQGDNPVKDFIPVARIADMLLHPGTPFRYNGGDYTYPDIKLIYWAGGNPFHHHQDLNRLRSAWTRPETVICQDIVWTATARHADIVLPATSPLERNDLMASNLDGSLVAMKKVEDPQDAARNDYDIFASMAGRLGFRSAFTEDRNEAEWLEHLYERSKQSMAANNITLPAYRDFWRDGIYTMANQAVARTQFAEFRADPVGAPLQTPSGKIEIYSEKIASFGYDTCPGHPVWMAPKEYLGAGLAETYPLHLISDQPATRLHSQLDHGAASQAAKVQGREPVYINPDDARARNISDGQIVRLFNARGACLAGAVLSDAVMPGVVRLSTGAWYDPEPETDDAGRALDVHGNPNLLTEDRGTSELAQGPIAHSALVQLEIYDNAPPVRAMQPPPVAG